MSDKQVIEIKDLGIVYPMTMLGKDTEEELKKYGRIAHSTYKDSLVYHLALDLKDYYTRERFLISFVKGLYSYGYSHDLWEVCIIRKKNRTSYLKGVKGNLTDKELVEYIDDAVYHLKNDKSYFDNLPIEYYE